LVTLIKRLIETISSSIGHYHLGLLIIIKFFSQCMVIWRESVYDLAPRWKV